MPDEVTLTLRRTNQDITVVMRHRKGAWEVKEAVNERGSSVQVSLAERLQLCQRAKAGEDETGL